MVRAGTFGRLQAAQLPKEEKEGSGAFGAKDQTGAMVEAKGKDRMEAPRMNRLRETATPRRSISYGLRAEPSRSQRGSRELVSPPSASSWSR